MHVVMRESWTDERLDDLNEKVEKGFADVGERFEDVHKRFEDVDKRFDKLEDRFEGLQKEMNMRFDSVHKLMFQGLLGIMGAMVTIFVGLAGLIIAQM
jgi:tetrahydromethanopterin S-methyltransferase subunit G